MLSDLNQKIYFISGPTAIGKSSFAIKLAKKINGIIINADSMQIYSNLKILTARPSKKDHKIVNHKLYGYVDASERYNVAKWCNDISKVLSENKKNKHPSIIVGGTGMYINALLNGLLDLPVVTEIIKKQSEELLNKVGLKNFVEKIHQFDPEALDSISLNDSMRLRRIWEIYKSSGIKYSQFKKNNNKQFLKKNSFSLYLFTPLREQIYQNVNIRFKKMIEEGVIEEVKRLISLNLDPSLPLMRAHGVREISNYLSNHISLEECIDQSQQVTRNYVKRQLTWWRTSRLPVQQVFYQFPNEIDEKMIKI